MKLLISIIISAIIAISLSGCTIINARYHHRHRHSGVVVTTRIPPPVVVVRRPPPPPPVVIVEPAPPRPRTPSPPGRTNRKR